MTRSPVTEVQVVQKIRRAGAFPGCLANLRVGIGDDAALFSPRLGYETVLTCDWFLEGTHFLRRKHPADSVGWKCLARAVSDVAAMGGQPRCFLLSLALPPACAGAWLNEFLAGLRRAQVRLGCALAGGDTTRSDRILIQVTVIGEVRSGFAVLRRGAKPGDAIFVSGCLGEAELGLRELLKAKQASRRDRRVRKHLYPEPRLKLGAWLAKNQLASAMMDLSDGLSSDLALLCAATGVGAKIEGKRLPLPAHSRLPGLNLLDLALHGGDDYELLFTVSREKRLRVPNSYKGLRLTQIGEITRQRTLRVADPERGDRSLKPAGWDSFRAHK